jgi:uncharacterized protein DUF6542
VRARFDVPARSGHFEALAPTVASLLALARRAALTAWAWREDLAARIQRSGIGPRARRAGFAVAAACGLLAVRAWLVFRALLAVLGHTVHVRALPRRRPTARVRTRGRAQATARAPSGARRAEHGPHLRLTARGGVVVMFVTCFLGLLIADWTNWEELADAVFFMASSLTAYYVRPGSLLPVAVSPPLLFFVAIALEKLAIVSGTLAALEGTLVMLAGAAPWLFAGTALTVGIALLRGLRREVRTLVLELRGS